MNLRKIRVEIIHNFILKNVFKGICYENVTACSPQGNVRNYLRDGNP